MNSVSVAIVMLAAVLVSGLVVRALPWPVPLPLLQIALGVAISLLSEGGVMLEPELFFLLFLPPLLFLDGWRIPKDALRRDWAGISQLAVGLVVLTMLVLGVVIHLMIPAMPLPVAFALAAIISPTDPVAVEGITRRIPVPRRVMHVLQGEALFNDASGLVAFRLAAAAAVTGAFSLAEAAVSFVWVAAAGLVVGVLVTRLLIATRTGFARRYGEEPALEVLLSLLTPFLAYLAAEAVGGSGILAVVAAGVTMSRVELTGIATPSTRMRRHIVWDMVQFTLNGIMFTLLGEQLPGIFQGAVRVVQETGHHDPWWLAIYAIVICMLLAAIRFAWVWLMILLGRLFGWRHAAGSRPDLRSTLVLSLGGVRGAVTLAGVMTLPLVVGSGEPLPARDLAIFLAATVILFSLLTASIGLPWVLRGLPASVSAQADAQRDRVWQEARLAATARVQTLARSMAQASTPPEARDRYDRAADRVLARLDELLGVPVEHAGAPEDQRERQAERDLRRAALAAARDAIYRLAREHQISDALARECVRRLDMEEMYLS